MPGVSSEYQAVLELLRTDDPPVARELKVRVVEELRAGKEAEVSVALENGLRDADPEFRCTVAWVFLVYDFLAALPHVGKLLLHDQDDGVQGYICQILGGSKRREAVPLLIEALKTNPDGTDRVNAAWGLGNIGDPAALPALQKATQMDDGVDYEGRPVKEIAAEAIRRITSGKAAASVA